MRKMKCRLSIWLLFTAYSLSLPAAVLEVCANCPYTSVRQAVAAATDGDELLIKSGIYREHNILVEKSLHLKGVGWPVIDGENKGEIFTLKADDVVLEGLQIQNVGNSYTEDRAGIRLSKSKRFSIRNNRLLNTFFGIYLAHCREGEVIGNTVAGEAVNEMSSGNAIHLWYCKEVRIERNEVRKHRDGIYFEFVDDSFISHNLSEDNLRYGLHFMFSNRDDYSQNTFRRNGAGVAVMFSKKISMWENIFEHNWGRSSYGLLLKEIYDAEIENNLFAENTVGIYVEGSSRINYRRNHFESNGWALKMSGGCLDNVVADNNFVVNTFDLSISSQINNNQFDGNFWSDYSGYDLDRNGVGDVPYRPVKLFNYIVHHTPEAIILLRSLFVDIINFSEKVSPVFTPANVLDNKPMMRKIELNQRTR